MEPSPQQKNKNEVEQVGGFLGIVLVVILLAVGGIYFLYTQYQDTLQNQQQVQGQTNS